MPRAPACWVVGLLGCVRAWAAAAATLGLGQLQGRVGGAAGKGGRGGREGWEGRQGFLRHSVARDARVPRRRRVESDTARSAGEDATVAVVGRL